MRAAAPSLHIVLAPLDAGLQALVWAHFGFPNSRGPAKSIRGLQSLLN
jgi:hypothetical protein